MGSAARRTRDARHPDVLPFRRVFTVAVAVCAVLVLLGFGPVFLAAQATRDSQQALLIKEDLDAAQARSEQLEMRHSVLTSSYRVENIAKTRLRMIAATEAGMTVDLSPARPKVAAAVAAPKPAVKPAPKASALDGLARLTAGQSSALMLGDVGLAATR
ncbi:MAG: hypothetical protein FWC48_02420 [Actinomycetia bacterium]|nr:hypothetical protein [Actinomycetes bacterium]